MKPKKTSQAVIRIKGARQNNLKNLDLDIPLNRITVVTGLSGSGKSSFAFDTLYAEGQRRYVETFSPYARQFMERMDRPLADRIENIPPAIAIDRKDPVRTSRSTVGTMTELTDYVKLLYARTGRLHCKRCGEPVTPETPEHVWRALAVLKQGTEIFVTFPMSLAGSLEQAQKELGRTGYTRIFQDGRILSIEDLPQDAQGRPWHVLADRLAYRTPARKRIIDSLEQAFRFGGGRLDLWTRSEGREETDRHLSFSSRLECATCAITYRPPIPNLFSFNSPVGACATCRGFGRILGMDLGLIIPDSTLSLDQGAIKPWGGRKEDRIEFRELRAFCRRRKIPTDKAFQHLPEEHQQAIIEGTKDYYGIRGFFDWLQSRTYKMHVRVFLSRYRTTLTCPECKGARFKEETLLYRIGELNIGEVYRLSVDEAARFFEALPLTRADKAAVLILEEVKNRLRYLREVGLGYLTLDRQSRTLSGGEVERVALTAALGSSLVNTLYVLDEPSIGLHPRDNHRLIRILQNLRDLQNTVVIVEHDPEIISRSDFMLDLGPGAGEEGGRVMYFGPTAGVKDSLTGRYLKGELVIPLPVERRKPQKDRWIFIQGASEHNLKKIHAAIPLGCFVCLTGVSGSGKSTLAEEIVYKGIKRAKGDPQGAPGHHAGMRGLELIEDVVLVDQRPIGRTPRANPLTYVKAMDPVRTLFMQTDQARAKGLGKKHFSFNVAAGRCETCQGTGFEKVEMQFLSDVFITCPDCGGKRFKQEILDVQYRGKNIHDILSMTIDRAMVFFEDQPALCAALQPLVDVGLGYMRLGQPIHTLSGGEAQRLKLSQHLGNASSEQSLFIFDEPTTGLHFEDIRRLLAAFQKLVDKGNTVLVIEHNMDVIKTADWVIDLGPEGGEAGGYIVVAGPPEKVKVHPGSHTGTFLKDYLAGSNRLLPLGSAPEPLLPAPEKPSITVKGAREHNLRDLTLSIPRKELVVVTGVSGSGKSTLVFDILFAEGQRRYLESLAPYVRQYVRILERPDVDSVDGLSPTVAIQQRISHSSLRSTVATLTEIYHFLRLLFSKLGTQHCPGCGRPLKTQNMEQIIGRVNSRFGGKKALLLAPKIAGRKGFHKDLLARALKRGYREARIDGRLSSLHEGMALSRYHEHTIDLLVGRLPNRDLPSIVRKTLEEGNGSMILVPAAGHEEILSLRGLCPGCGIGLQALDPRLFSFNSKQGSCPRCDGLGRLGDGDKERSRPLSKMPWQSPQT
jgi:excinuclease ABC subunit A